MRTVRSARGATLVVAVLALGVTWIAVGEPAPASPRDPAQSVGIERGASGTVTSADIGEAVSASVLVVQRTAEPRLGPMWALPGLAAGLAALCVLRRLRATPAPPARRVLLRDSVSRRAPPLGSFA
jgi:hypothetical protein